MSQPYYSKTLTELANAAGTMLHKERASLWRMKHLLTKLTGDHTWIPCGELETLHDIDFFVDGRSAYREHRHAKQRIRADEEVQNDETLTSTTADQQPNGDATQQEERTKNAPRPEDDVAMIDATAQTLIATGPKTVTSENQAHPPEDAVDPDDTIIEDEDVAPRTEGDEGASNRPGESTSTKEEATNQEKTVGEDKDDEGDEDETMEIGDDEEDVPAPPRMRTRAQAQAASDNTQSRTRSATPESSNESFIHPYFLAPPSSHLNRDFGLPEPEAAETRRLLQLYIQKQEEVVRGAQKVHDGLLRADRLRKTVMRWATAEAHVGEMSDNEDWYDKDEWGLDAELKKGQDEEEEDTATTAKKTRTRRQ
jgi:hypothetical protein